MGWLFLRQRTRKKEPLRSVTMPSLPTLTTSTTSTSHIPFITSLMPPEMKPLKNVWTDTPTSSERVKRSSSASMTTSSSLTTQANLRTTPRMMSVTNPSSLRVPPGSNSRTFSVKSSGNSKPSSVVSSTPTLLLSMPPTTRESRPSRDFLSETGGGDEPQRKVHQILNDSVAASYANQVVCF